MTMKQVKSHRPIKLDIDYSSREDLQEFASNTEFNQFILENTFEPLKYAINKNKTQCILFEVGGGDYKVKQKYSPYHLEPPPVYDNEGRVYNSKNKLFCLVHQYDRVPELKNIILNKFK